MSVMEGRSAAEHVADQKDHSRSPTGTLLIAAGLGIAAVGAAVLSGQPLPYAAAVLVVPLLTVVGGRAAALWPSRDDQATQDRRGYLPVALFVLAATVIGLSSKLFLGPAQLVAVGFTYIGWIRRDVLVAGACSAALVAVAPVDIKGPVVLSLAEPFYAGLSIMTVATILIGLGSLTIVRRKGAHPIRQH